ncbi:Ig-like domain-containing protein [Mycolicibacterium chubuense]|uniref:Tandem-95 repeat protein n=1 Tax=Mycolicibacterium chubuense TaxID=1800 RepID=A0A0J6W6S9_MYCCU|nr:Ig-like domain-containing protein [Mycolicibacterium chubuense]KMO77513.1 hypothetical protein MCHUDSM44219_03170 [Mycolicibacterium chubuense]SPX96595.1 VCBS repeat-containing protein [Mycolicibacterium chubuense]
MGFSRHIGRIGALAVALGVGTGVGACPGIAWADESTESTSSVAGPSSRSDDAPTPGPATNTKDSDDAGDTHASEDGASHETTDTDADADTDDAESDPAPARERKGRKAHRTPPKEESAVDRTPRTETDAPARDVTPDASAAEPARNTEPEPEPEPAPREAPAVVETAVPAAAEVVPEPPAATTRIRLTDLLSTLLTPGGAPTAPAESPAMWVLAAAARRQLGHTETAALVSASQDPVAELPVVNDPDDAGVVTGSVAVPGAQTAVASSPGKGSVTVSVNDGTVSFTYKPTRQARHAAAALGAADDAKTDTFVLTVSDGAGGSTLVPITVAVSPANADPKVTVSTPRVSLTSAEVRASVRVRDADGDAFAFTVSPTAKGGSVTIDEDGHISYLPTDAARHAAAAADATDADKTDTFDVTVADGYGGLVTVTLTVPIKPDNVDPKVTVRTRSSWFSDEVTGVVKAKDPNGDPVSYDVTPSIKGGTVTIDEQGRFVYTPSAQARHEAAADGAGRRDKQDTFLVTVTDDHGGITRTLVTVGIKPANTPPASAATRDVFTNPNTGVVAGTVVAVDPDGDPFTYRFPAKTRKGALEIDEDGVFTYTPTEAARAQASKPFAPSWAKTDAFRVTVDDGHGGTTTLTVRVSIAPLGGPNQAPTDGGYTASQPGALTGKVTGAVTATDPDRDLLTFTGSGPTAKGAVMVNADGTFTYTPSDAARHQATADNATAADLSDTFTVTASDGYGGTLDIPVTVAIKPSVNRAPARGTYVADADALTGVVSGRVGAIDADGDLLTYRGTAVTEKGSVVVYNGGEFTYTPTDAARAAAGAPKAPLADKRDSFTVTVDDGHGGTLAVTVRVTIVPASVTSAL